MGAEAMPAAPAAPSCHDDGDAREGKKKKEKSRDSEYRRTRQEARRLAREQAERSEGAASAPPAEIQGKRRKKEKNADTTAGREAGAVPAEARLRGDGERKSKPEEDGDSREYGGAEGRADGDAEEAKKGKRRRKRRARGKGSAQADEAEEAGGDTPKGLQAAEGETEAVEPTDEAAAGAEGGKRKRKRKRKRRDGSGNADDEVVEKDEEDEEEIPAASPEVPAPAESQSPPPDAAVSSPASPEDCSSQPASAASPPTAEAIQERSPKPEFTTRFCVVSQQSEGDASAESDARILHSLHPCVVETLRRRKIGSLFPVQRTVVSFLTRCIDKPYDPQNCDLCVSAPTGEGKTFCYVLPIVSFLLGTVVRTTRCVVLTPTRELAAQVAEEFSRFRHFHASPFLLLQDTESSHGLRKARAAEVLPCSAAKCSQGSFFCRDISVACLVGELSGHATTRGGSAASADGAATANRDVFFSLQSEASPRGSALALPTSPASASAAAAAAAASPPDVVICTPGKFTELVRAAVRSKNSEALGRGGLSDPKEAAFFDEARDLYGDERVCLDDVQWLVIDEADRLVRQPYHDWMKAVEALHRLRVDACFMQRPAAASSLAGASCASTFSASLCASASLPLQKLTFSATMTKNPKSLASLNLTRPFFVLSTPSGHYSMPLSLAQRYVVCDASDKPLCLVLLLLHLVRSLKHAPAPGASDLQPDTLEQGNDDAEEAAEADAAGSGNSDDDRGDANEASDADECDDTGESREAQLPGGGRQEEPGKKKKSLKALVFCGTRDSTHRLTRLLQLYFERSADRQAPASELRGMLQLLPSISFDFGLQLPSPWHLVWAFSHVLFLFSVVVVCSCSSDKRSRVLSCQLAPLALPPLGLFASRSASASVQKAVAQEGPQEDEAADGEGEEAAKATAVSGQAHVQLRIRELSSSLTQRARMKLLNQFKHGAVEILVCSDLAARGLDVAGLDAVFHYDAPQHVQAYVHRSGRSARAGAQGLCVTLVAPPQMRAFREMIKKKNAHLWKILREIHVDLCRQDEGFQQGYAALLKQLSACLALEAKGRLDAQSPLPPPQLLAL
ncbi:DEAD/DEAH box helicase domain-containing protein [Besnoitia besnoiti]|uniref:DEAD/DEAH box helicase domain-containing protein n=1 Tax=Besnoitia besnoiti TaxID=94643 RepID=A0A2A9M9R1_BESBE|nr:DEAD/DEAH box helicase domain-containing protein [Besnoitia besnoiti]PFH32337.1 DEAD/DEAH box helicase domain-containing protein [Besnoitia besnoiti]